MKYLFLVLFLPGCMPFAYAPKNKVDPALESQFTKFMELSAQKNVSIQAESITIEFTTHFNEPFWVGSCLVGKNVQPRIRILQSYWITASDARKEQLMFHELGHCLLGREHDQLMTVDQNETIPQSIMTSVMFDDRIYLRHHDYYIHELFGR